MLGCASKDHDKSWGLVSADIDTDKDVDIDIDIDMRIDIYIDIDIAQLCTMYCAMRADAVAGRRYRPRWSLVPCQA